MKITKEHNCRILKNQLYDSQNYMAVQEMENKIWYLVNCDHGVTQAFYIKYCPYCGCLLEDNE